MDINAVRKDTPLTRSTIYLDTAAASLPPDPVLDAVRAYLQETGHIGIYLPAFRKKTYERVEAVRAQLASFLNAAQDEVAFTKNATEAISLVASGFPWRAGDEVLVADTEMISNLLPWKRLESSHSVTVKMVKADAEGLLAPQAFETAITPRTRLLTFSHLPNSTGALQNAQSLCAVARKHGVLSLVNASQSVGMVATDVAEIDCDFLVGCGRKALRATEGTGFLYIRRALIAQVEPVLSGWWNGVYDRETGALSFVDGARRFEAGCPNIPAILGLGAALTYAREIGIDAIEHRVRDLTSYAVKRLTALPGLEMYGPRDCAHRMGIVPFNVRGVNPAKIVVDLEARHCIIEAGNFMADAILSRFGVATMARISLHYFNTHDEIDKVAGLIEAATRN
ncbi:TPA: aminotransferase class V-fold PLP-dependent enzyme [Salmonella enterica]|uniref:Aminotransferase class V-fold PLP-dependent enzyme n=1 Tax=Salmonella enterica TaxID=28901 RepID=A0A744CEJ2_SALER|nr:aminotransferase class V-fold PLP-dependent enzyme [Salmonella enterica]HAF4920014.1 aminotransferase class V-fold PLP-dependent enzyme [Salmonella enterica]